MKKRLLGILAIVGIIVPFYLFTRAAQPQKTNVIQPVPFTDVNIADEFWTPRMETNRKVSIPHMFKKFEESGRTESKTLEAALTALALHPDAELEKLVKNWLEQIVSPPSADKSEKTRPGISLGSGHMYEAAATHYQITGQKNFLNRALESAEAVASLFGPDKRRDVPGHQGIEVGLVRLYRATGNDQYWKLAKFFLDERGKSHEFFGRTLYC